MLNKILILISAILVLPGYTTAFFWGSSDESTPSTRYYYHKRLIQGPQYTVVEPESKPIPSLPVQVPLQAQFAPYPHVQNVQLVPCLCPVSQDKIYEHIPYESVYVNPSFQVQQGQPHLQQNVPQRQPQKS